MNESIRDIGDEIQSLHVLAVQTYTSIVDGILASGSRDISGIEHTLDGLLDFCGYAPALDLYKTLCRHHWYIDPVGTAFYINAYREMYDQSGLDSH